MTRSASSGTSATAPPLSTEADPTHVYTKAGRYTAILKVIDSSGQTSQLSTIITVGNTSPTLVVTGPIDGGVFSFGDKIQYKVTVTDPEDPAINCNDVTVTFVLGHDTHGHAEQSSQGCIGFLQTDPTDVAHGGNVFGVISATYTDKGGQGANSAAPPLTTTSQVQIRQRRQEVENVVNQLGTATATNTDTTGVGGPVHRSAITQGDWLQLNGPFNLFQIGTIAIRYADGTAGRTAGTPLAAIDIRQDSITGPVIATANLTSTGGVDTWATTTVPIAMTGKHEVFVTFRTVTGGQTGANVVNLNWVEFGGNGVTVQEVSTPARPAAPCRRPWRSRSARPPSSARSRRASRRRTPPATTATVISTAGDALLSVADPSSNATGHLVNGAFSLPQPLQVRARYAAASPGPYFDLRSNGSPLNLFIWNTPVSNDVVNVEFSQLINANDALRTGAYGKSLTFTLSTTTP